MEGENSMELEEEDNNNKPIEEAVVAGANQVPPYQGKKACGFCKQSLNDAEVLLDNYQESNLTHAPRVKVQHREKKYILALINHFLLLP